jgi:hypothetical protein
MTLNLLSSLFHTVAEIFDRLMSRRAVSVVQFAIKATHLSACRFAPAAGRKRSGGSGSPS